MSLVIYDSVGGGRLHGRPRKFFQGHNLKINRPCYTVTSLTNYKSRGAGRMPSALPTSPHFGRLLWWAGFVWLRVTVPRIYGSEHDEQVLFSHTSRIPTMLAQVKRHSRRCLRSILQFFALCLYCRAGGH